MSRSIARQVLPAHATYARVSASQRTFGGMVGRFEVSLCALARRTDNQPVASLHSLGDRVPAVLFKSALHSAMTTAGNGRGTFVQSYDIDVQFTILSDRTDVRVLGLGDHAECEFRAVGDTVYQRFAAWEYEPGGGVEARLQWTHQAIGESMYGPSVAGIGTPMGLVGGISDGQDVIVAASDSATTTYEVAIVTSAIQRALAENTSGEGYEVNDPTRVCLVVLDERGLPVTVSPRDQDYPFTFRDWG